jgi:hypothetical protein
MLLQYCDGCNLRIEPGGAVSVGEHTYCRACAQKHAAPQAAPGSSGTRGIVRPPSVQRGSPGGGARETGALPGLRRATPGTGILRRSPTAEVPAPPRAPSSRTTGSAAPVGAAARHAAAPDSAKTLTWVLAGAGALLAILGVVLITRGSGKAKADGKDKGGASAAPAVATADPKPSGGSPTPTGTAKPAATATGTPTKVANATPPEPPKTDDAPAKPRSGLFGMGAADDMDDIRESSARRQIDKIREMEKSGAGNVFDIRYLLELLVNSRRSTKAGREAAEWLAKLPPIDGRPADTPGATQAGLWMRSFEKGDDDIGLEGINFANYKSIASRAAANIDYGHKSALGGLADGRQDHIVLSFTGFVETPRDGKYKFSLRSDDGSALYIGNLLIINNGGAHPMQESEAEIALKAGKHRFRVDFWQGAGDAGLIVAWSGPELNKETIPAAAFSYVPGQ